MIIRSFLILIAVISTAYMIFFNPEALLNSTFGERDMRFSFRGAAHIERHCGYDASWKGGNVNIFYRCALSDLEAKDMWRQNIRLLAEVFEAEDDYQCIPFTNALSWYEYTGTPKDRVNLIKEMESLASLMLAAAETARRSHYYVPSIKSSARFWEVAYLWGAAIVAGPMIRGISLPKADYESVAWKYILIQMIRGITSVVKNQYYNLKSEIDMCSSADATGIGKNLDIKILGM
ncbi:hypothetical protein [Methylobacterium sp. WL8]|uniref:hypothetical protein n=1 Tax=Methylobacterium sp. WL8 TaxID=2603899 RepID=UPI0011CB47F5|nr:hypothetical protein [Methylobacterium sp. WL8]TXN79000.1 hypothetical protein FV234_21935 [Methylobacterium sp. WL8]